MRCRETCSFIKYVQLPRSPDFWWLFVKCVASHDRESPKPGSWRWTHMVVMFSSRSSTPPLRFPAPLGPWKDGIGNSVLLSGLLQMMSVEEQEQEGGQSGRSPRPLWRRTGNRIRAFQSGNIDPRTSIPHKKDVGPFILLTLKHGQKNNKPRKFAQSITAALSSFLSLQPKRSVARERSVCVCARLIERSQV